MVSLVRPLYAVNEQSQDEMTYAALARSGVSNSFQRFSLENLPSLNLNKQKPRGVSNSTSIGNEKLGCNSTGPAGERGSFSPTIDLVNEHEVLLEDG